MGTDNKPDHKYGITISSCGGSIKVEALKENTIGLRVNFNDGDGAGWLYMTTAEAQAHLQALTEAVDASA